MDTGQAMASRFVVDACALVKAFAADEPKADAFTSWIRQQRLAGSELLAPPLLRYELGQVLCRAVSDGKPSAEQRRRILDNVLLGFRFVDPLEVEEHAPPLSFYDASYLSLAKSVEAVLVTYDQALAGAARQAGIDVLAPT